MSEINEFDKQQQIDELEALRSIFGDDLFLHSQTHFELAVTPFLEMPLMVTVHRSHSRSRSRSPVSSDAGKSPMTRRSPTPERSEDSEADHSEIRSSFKVKFLTPLRLEIHYVPQYPSSAPPNFTLHCSWLSRGQLALLCQRLDGIWREQEGSPCVFTWAQYLKDECLTAVGVSADQGMDVFRLADGKDPFGDGKHPEDSRGQVERESNAELVITDLKTFDKTMREVEVKGSTLTCGICFCDVMGSEVVMMDECFHAFCKDCVRAMCEVHIRQGTVRDIVCPDSKCKELISPSIVKDLVSHEAYQRYERFMLEQTLGASDGVIYCPQDKCGIPMLVEPDTTFGFCPFCSTAFCVRCKAIGADLCDCTRYADVLHTSGAKVLLSSGKSAVSEDGGASAATREQERKDRAQRLRELTQKVSKLSLPFEPREMSWYKDLAKCPKCGALVNKDGGCNKVMCFMCRSYFCWVCLQRIGGYDHFAIGMKCALFEEVKERGKNDRVVTNMQKELHENQDKDAVDSESERVRQLKEVKKAERTLRAQISKLCPQCKRSIVKEGFNNHAVCPHCSCQFCFVCCSKLQRGTTSHFLSGKCPQHS